LNVRLDVADIPDWGACSTARAEEILAERPSIVLSASAAKAFNQALQRPTQVNERLAQALKRTRSFTWLD
jgi:uncharacterized protein (DUF1778 family)